MGDERYEAVGASRFAFHTTCRAGDCRDAIRERARGLDAFYCTPHESGLLRRLTTWVEQAVMKGATEAYVGRTYHPERRLLEHFGDHGRDHLAVLHWAADWNEADCLETTLIKAFRHKAKLTNAGPDPDGDRSGPWNCVYVSWARKGDGKRIHAESVEGLHWRRRTWPDAGFPAVPKIFQARMDQEDARPLVRAWWEHVVESRRTFTRARRG